MSGLLELANRCEKAGGPDRELDACIAATLRVGTDYGWADNYPAWSGRADGRVSLEEGGPSFAAPVYTASIDAAITLVPDGLTFGCGGWDSTGKPWAWVGRNKGPKDVLHLAEGGATPALALCAAALRARAAGDAR